MKTHFALTVISFFICIQFVIMQTILPKRLFQFGTSYH